MFGKQGSVLAVSQRLRQQGDRVIGVRILQRLGDRFVPQVGRTVMELQILGDLATTRKAGILRRAQCRFSHRLVGRLDVEIANSLQVTFGHHHVGRRAEHRIGVTVSRGPAGQIAPLPCHLDQRDEHVALVGRRNQIEQGMRGAERVPQRHVRVIRKTGGPVDRPIEAEIISADVAESRRHLESMVKGRVENRPLFFAPPFDTDG